MPKYHISPKTGLASECKAKVNPCPYLLISKHYDNLQDANIEADRIRTEQAIEKTFHQNRKPIIVPKETLCLPEVSTITDTSLIYFGGMSATVTSIEHHYDSCTAVIYRDLNEPCRDTRIASIEIDPNPNIDVHDILKRLGGTYVANPGTEVPEDLVDKAYELGLDTTEAYVAKGIPGPYGDEPEIFLKQEIAEQLYEYYISRENSTDRDGILDYVRSKGYATPGLTPLQAIRNQLNSENLGRTHPDVEKATQAKVMDLKIGNIIIPNQKHLNKVPPRLIRSGTSGKEIAGVVVMRNNKPHLVDGYHRYKNIMNNEADTKYTYIVLA